MVRAYRRWMSACCRWRRRRTSRGAHAGNADVMLATVTMAATKGVAIGAHPGYADREEFGRRELGLSPGEIERQVTEQVAAMAACCKKAKARLRYVKPHGALYNRAVRDFEAARAIVTAMRRTGDLVLLCLPDRKSVV